MSLRRGDPSQNPARLIAFTASQNGLFWLPTFFLYFEAHLPVDQVFALQAAYYLAGALLEVPAGLLSDRIGRRGVLLGAALANALGAALLFGAGGSFPDMLLGQCALAAAVALISGTDTALLYESLEATGRSQELLLQETRLQRASLLALGGSALIGGWIGVHDLGLPYLATAVSALLGCFVAWGLVDIQAPVSGSSSDQGVDRGPSSGVDPRGAAVSIQPTRTQELLGLLRRPTLLWCLAVAIGAMVLNHVPLEFLQPILREALAGLQLSTAFTPTLSGAVFALTMAVGALAGAHLPRLVNRFGAPAVSVAALLLQSGVILALAWFISPWIASLLLLRSVPQALLQPAQRVLIHPLLPNRQRATWFSLQSLLGQLAFGLLLWSSGRPLAAQAHLTPEDLARVLLRFALGGLALCCMLWILRPRRLAGSQS